MRRENGKKWADICRLILFSVLAMLVAYSCEKTTGPDDSPVTVTKKLLIYSDLAAIPANGGAARILVKVYSGTDTAAVMSNVRVQFSANLGSVQVQNDLTDANGYARAIAYGGAKTGNMAVTATIENYSNTIFVSITPGAGLVFASPSEILADGVSQSAIAATVVDSLGQPLPGALVRFVVTAGTITAQSYSNESGRAEAILRSVSSVTDLSATVTATSASGKVAAIVGENIDAAAKPAATQGLLGTTTVVFKGITISGVVDKSTVFANSADSTSVRISVKETTSGSPVPNAKVNFSSNLGALRAKEKVTDSSGNAAVIFFGGNVSGVAAVKATLSGELAYTTEISLTKQLYMNLMSSPSSLAANGSDTSVIKAQITD
ncbi:MAG: Ig-like domain-containing protein, partial [Candidatus Latescibacterota bacterium]